MRLGIEAVPLRVNVAGFSLAPENVPLKPNATVAAREIITAKDNSPFVGKVVEVTGRRFSVK